MQLIIGIDPGTTVGFAILDLNGTIVKVSSSKELSLNSLTKIIYQHGKPLAVGCDKKNVPSFVKEFSAKTGCELFHPDYDLGSLEKKSLARFKTKNDHESDALASAVFVFNKLKVKLRRIKQFANENNGDFDKLVELVIKKKINLTEAFVLLNKKEVTIIKKRSKQNINIQKLIDKINLLTEENEEKRLIIKELNNKLKSVSDKKLNVKSKTTKVLDLRLLDQKEKEILDLKKETLLLKQFLDERNNLVVKKFKDLNNITTKDKVIIVDNPQNFSQKEVDKLKENLSYIISNNEASLPFLIIKKEKLILKETKNYALINKKEFEKRINKKELFDKIVTEYQRFRK